MNPYEITFIVRPDLDEEQTSGVVRQVTSRLETLGGEVIASYPWSPARRRMAYPLRDFGDGYYVTTTFRLDAQTVRELESALRLNDNLLRFLIVQATDQMIRQSQQRMHQATAAAAPRPAPVAAPGAQPAPEVVENVAEVVAAQVPEGATESAAPTENVERAPVATAPPVEPALTREE